ncbi:MAG: hypothetical protein AB7P69_00930 [Candidatus Binatia bacterium]
MVHTIVTKPERGALMAHDKWLRRFACSLMLSIWATTAAAAPPVLVTNNADAGGGSFRDAIAQANADAKISGIRFDAGLGGPIELISTVTYTGGQALKIEGNGATITAAVSNTSNLFSSTGGGNLAIEGLIFEGGSEQGIFVSVPVMATKIVRLWLREVLVRGNGLHGVYIDDSNGSAASVELRLDRTAISNNGLLGVSDFDGVRVDEAGAGDIIFMSGNSLARGNGGDGVELDEQGAGDVHATLTNSSFDGNGFLDPNDLEDGFDIDEADDGSIFARIYETTATGNFDGGFDLDEAGKGDIDVSFVKVQANNNAEDCIKASEEDEGNVKVSLGDSIVGGSTNNDGVQFEEEGEGNIEVWVVNSLITDNDGSGLDVSEANAGSGKLFLKQVTLLGNDDPQVSTSGGVVVFQ